jgi:hypothetical protein
VFVSARNETAAWLSLVGSWAGYWTWVRLASKVDLSFSPGLQSAGCQRVGKVIHPIETNRFLTDLAPVFCRRLTMAVQARESGIP